MLEWWHKVKQFLVKLLHFERRGRINRYVFPVAVTVLVFIFKIYTFNIFGIAGAFLSLTLIVILSSLYGGMGPGILATILAATANYFIFLRKDLGVYPSSQDLILTTIFLFEGFLISTIAEAYHEVDMQKDEFVGFLAHELKNPLSAIQGFAELALIKAKRKKDQKAVLYSSEVITQSERLAELINDLLDIRKIEIGKFTYQDMPFEFDGLIAEQLMHQRIISKRDIIFTGKTGKTISADRYRIGQVVNNLLTNALKYSPPECPIMVKARTAKGKIILSVKDQGIGVSMQDKDRIFSEFYRTTRTQKDKTEGLGLGLYISSQIVKNYHGRLWVKSKEGHGATFFMELPINY